MLTDVMQTQKALKQEQTKIIQTHLRNKKII